MQSVSLSIAFTLIFCLGSVAHASEPSDRGASEARRLYESGMKHYNVGEYKEALQSFKDAYFAKPDAVFLFNMGQCFRQLNQPADAAREYRAYLRESPDAPNRAEVERLISAAEDQVRQQNATAPPTGILPAGSKE